MLSFHPVCSAGQPRSLRLAGRSRLAPVLREYPNTLRLRPIRTDDRRSPGAGTCGGPTHEGATADHSRCRRRPSGQFPPVAHVDAWAPTTAATAPSARAESCMTSQSKTPPVADTCAARVSSGSMGPPLRVLTPEQVWASRPARLRATPQPTSRHPRRRFLPRVRHGVWAGEPNG